MDEPATRDFLLALYATLLGRTPPEPELQEWIATVRDHALAPAAIVQAFANSEEYRARQGTRATFPAGHFHSPVVNPAEAAPYLAREHRRRPEELPGIALDLPQMRGLWLRHVRFNRDWPLPPHAMPGHRYGHQDGPFPAGDAIALRIVMHEYRPRRIIEIGSGHSTACMLDIADHLGLDPLAITCIDPDPIRLHTLLTAPDRARLTIRAEPIQQVDPDIVDTLEPGDILFIDSTHVLKTGSDVHYELFYLLPRLRPGVLVHIHDIHYPFEYPRAWVLEDNHSWNEAYALRALLMHQQRWQILYWGSALARLHGAEMQSQLPVATTNPGGSIWLECTEG